VITQPPINTKSQPLYIIYTYKYYMVRLDNKTLNKIAAGTATKKEVLAYFDHEVSTNNTKLTLIEFLAYYGY
jgi:hypothetical protein